MTRRAQEEAACKDNDRLLAKSHSREILPLLLRVPRLFGVVLQVALSFVAGKFQNVIVLLSIPSYGKPDRPRPSVDGWIFDASFVLDGVGIGRRIALDDMKGIRRKVSHHVEPS